MLRDRAKGFTDQTNTVLLLYTEAQKLKKTSQGKAKWVPDVSCHYQTW